MFYRHSLLYEDIRFQRWFPSPIVPKSKVMPFKESHILISEKFRFTLIPFVII